MADTGSAECRPSASSADQTVDLRDCTIPCFDQYHLNAANGVEPSSVMAFVGSVPQQDHVSAAATTAATSDNWMFQQTQQHVQIPYWAMNQTPIPIEQFGKEAFNHMMILPSGSLPDGQQLAQKGPGGKITPSASTPTMTVHHRHSLPELPLSSSSSSTSSSSLRCRRRTVGSIPPSQDQDEEQKRKNFLERNRQAALKCRQRKKQWLENLQKQVEYLNADNEKLERQVTTLREEILNLKTLLLAHQNCPVAQANGVVYDAVMKPN